MTEQVRLDTLRGGPIIGPGPSAFGDVVAKRCQEERQRGDALLTINQEPASECCRCVPRRDVDDGPQEVTSLGRIRCDLEDVLPQLFALRLVPTVVALKDGD